MTSYTYQTTAVGLPFNIPANLQEPRLTSNTPRTQINVFDTTSRRFFNVDYNHTFNAAGTHQLKGGAGFQRSTNDVENSYPGGYVYIYWNSILTGAQGQRGHGNLRLLPRRRLRDPRQGGRRTSSRCTFRTPGRSGRV